MEGGESVSFLSVWPRGEISPRLRWLARAKVWLLFSHHLQLCYSFDFAPYSGPFLRSLKPSVTLFSQHREESKGFTSSQRLLKLLLRCHTHRVCYHPLVKTSHMAKLFVSGIRDYSLQEASRGIALLPGWWWLFSRWVVSDSLQPHGLQCTRLPCPSLTPRVCSDSCPFNRWCHPTISSSVVPFSFLQSFPASGAWFE